MTSAPGSFTQVPNLPHVSYGLSRSPSGVLFLNLFCARCGDHTRKPCTGLPDRVNRWVLYYGSLHVHGG
jgi:hypothetical protein